MTIQMMPLNRYGRRSSSCLWMMMQQPRVSSTATVTMTHHRHIHHARSRTTISSIPACNATATAVASRRPTWMSLPCIPPRHVVRVRFMGSGGGGRGRGLFPTLGSAKLRRRRHLGELLGVICWLWVFYRAREDLPVLLGYRHPWESHHDDHQEDEDDAHMETLEEYEARLRKLHAKFDEMNRKFLNFSDDEDEEDEDEDEDEEDEDNDDEKEEEDEDEEKEGNEDQEQETDTPDEDEAEEEEE